MDRGALRRRDVLAASGALVVSGGLSGCVFDSRGSLRSQNTTTTGSPSTQTPPPSSADAPPDSTAAPRSQRVSFRATHGAELEGTLYGAGDCGIVLIPQSHKDRHIWRPQAKTYAQLGHLALTTEVDPTNRTESVLGAIRFMRREQNVTRLLLIGASTGGKAALEANVRAEAGAVDGTVTLSANGGAENASELQGRLLFMISEDERPEYVRVGHALAENAPEPKELITYSGGAHARALVVEKHGDAVRRRLRKFVSTVCTGS